MTAPTKVPFSRVLQALLVIAALALIVNPELRALLLLTNALGFEVVGILLVIQLRLAFAGAARYSITALVCTLAARLGYLALVAYPTAVALLLFDRLLCPALVTVSYGLACQPSNNRWRRP
ncbi:MAG TPA: hypothetical protein VEH00_06950 [Steroidobacteraceae bacterium]|nr:hypothetical protein [Steroidobacteraceae bacterium]